MATHDIVVPALAVILVALLGYFFLVRPQLKRIADSQKFAASLKVGDRIVTSGGLVGTITKCEGSRIVEIDLGNSVRVQALRRSIESKFEE